MFRKAFAAAAVRQRRPACRMRKRPDALSARRRLRSAAIRKRRSRHDRYRISFKGNSLTDRETVENYMLFRAAELTLQSGYDTFTIVNRDTDKNSARAVLAASWARACPTSISRPRYGWIGAWDPFWTPSRYEQVTRYEAYRRDRDGPRAQGLRPQRVRCAPGLAEPRGLITRPATIGSRIRAEPLPRRPSRSLRRRRSPFPRSRSSRG